jgi:hypothetical protein
MNRRQDFVVFVTCGEEQVPFFLSLDEKLQECTWTELVVVQKHGKEHQAPPNKLRWKDIESGVSDQF